MVLISYAFVHLSVICVVRFLNVVEETSLPRYVNEAGAVTSPGVNHMQRNATERKRDTNAIKTAAMLIVAFAICWLPMAIMGCIWAREYPKGHQEFRTRERKKSLLNELYFWCQFLAHLSSLLNPFVFTMRDACVRKRVSKMWNKLCWIRTQNYFITRR